MMYVPKIWSDFVLLGHFLTFYPTNNPKNLNFEKMKKKPGDIIILNMCTKNYDHMIKVPEIWCETDGQEDRGMDGKSDI